ncbi:16S rRNA (guanine1207-N2)-methyltransferase [Evansella vedderi]|uniref:16S rRNA (Guanine1207-N2)-methyltransferase n=1 Tax=Evansella vedderi TaxID=38282 RepID=A0ABT9ZXN3_9BACI|nr:class I SAM-dependent methyltransferase [Evansella vedderi]MDQ0255996.1 16S rRNA (guanine1207-N2)-methyltransferase [Evansella vedderi]
MADHYYTEKPNVHSDKKQITETIGGRSLKFNVDRGVFSKGGLDFGTRLLIESIKLPEVNGDIGDIGCGWGPIGISLALNYPDRRFVMVDINDRAVSLTKENAKLNGVDNVEVFQNNLLNGQEGRQFSAIITNPPIRAGKEVIYTLYEQASSLLLPGGELWIVIQKKQGAPSTIKKLEELSLEVETVEKSKGYFILKGKKC